MNCQEVMELMHRQLDDDLSESERDVLMAHTSHCPDCAAMFERLKLLSAELSSLPKVVPSYSLVDAILPQLERIELLGSKGSTIEKPSRIEIPIIPEQTRRIKRTRRFPSWSALGGVIAAGVVAGLFLVTYPPNLSNNAKNSAEYSADESVAQSQSDAFSTSSYNAGSASPGGDDVSEIDVKTKMMVPSGFTGIEKEIDFSAKEPASRSVQSNNNGTIGGSSALDQQGDVPAPVNNPSAEGETMKNDELTSHEAGSIGIEKVSSPDGNFVARVDSHRITVVSVSNGEKLIETSRKNGKHGQLVWSEDGSELTYEVHLDRGAIEKYVITTSTWKEKKATR